MRTHFLALIVGCLLAPLVTASDLRPFDDAPLHAVQFVDAREGWAVGDEGVIWHTINGGKDWERQPTGVRASLRSLHFLTPWLGWVAGREELPGGGSAGVLLRTTTGGQKWERVTLNALPGLNRVRFADNNTGLLAGDGTDQYPSGVFRTTDSGRTWVPLPGPRTTTWLTGDFFDPQTATLGGAWNRLATVRASGVNEKDIDSLGGRSLRGLQAADGKAVAVGQGGVILVNDDIKSSRWELVDLRVALPREAQAAYDLHGVCMAAGHVWVVGRPGSVLLHSADRGATWQTVRTQQPLPLNAVFFLDEKVGWTVGELGAILGTTDGGQTWTVQRRGAERAAVLFVHSRPQGVPFETVAGLGGDEGYITTALRIAAPDAATAAPASAAESLRFAAACRQAGGAAGESLWQFPLPQHTLACDKAELVKHWDRRHGGQAGDELLRQLVLALRIWRPEVIVTDAEGPEASGLVAEAMRAAFQRAADPTQFPEQIRALGLQAWKASKLYARQDGREKSLVVYDASSPAPRLAASPRDFAAPAAALFSATSEDLPAQRFYALLDSRMEGAASHRNLMQGVALAPRGEARRDLGEVAALPPEIEKAIRTRQNLQALASFSADGKVDPNRLLTQVRPSLDALPESQGAPAAYGLACSYARVGQWGLAREVFGMLLERYPTHPLSAEACRWLIRHQTSSEMRRRQDLGQFLSLTQYGIQATPRDTPTGGVAIPARPKEAKATGPLRYETKTTPPRIEVVAEQEAGVMENREESRRWYQTGLALEPKLTAFGPLFAGDPGSHFALNAARRTLGDFETPKKWYTQFANRQPAGPWRDAAQAELWLVNRTGAAPKPTLPCRLSGTRPFLDGKLDDACWQGAKPIALKSTSEKGGRADEAMAEYSTEVFFAYDKDHLYLGLRCRHPADRHVAPVKTRSRDANLRPFDRVSLMLDLDRDYATYFHLQVDQRGCVHEEFCQDGFHDRSWNPQWFVACHSTADVWQIEAALPLRELTGDPVTLGKAWACNVVRTVPGRGVQAAALPADVEPRPEGMGLLLFSPDGRRTEGETPLTMPREP